MLMPDVNVLIYAHRSDASPEHHRYAEWLTDVATGNEPFALSSLVLGGVVRIVTNPRAFLRPSTLDEVFAFLAQLTRRPNARVFLPGPRHLAVFESLCRQSSAQGKLVADAFHAALAIEHGCLWVSADGDFARFPGLRWRHPLQAA